MVRILIWSAVLVCMATPVALLTMVPMKLMTGGPTTADMVYEQLQSDRRMVGDVSGIRSSARIGVLEEARLKQLDRPASLTASAEMASGSVRSIEFVALRFSGLKPAKGRGNINLEEIVYPDGYRKLSLDITRAGRRGIILISDQPVRWSVKGLGATGWPRLGFDGKAAFDIVEAQPNSLAGFRISAFGSQGSMRVPDSAKVSRSEKRSFCKSIKLWRDHFGLPESSKVRFSLLDEPTQITLTNGVIKKDGERMTNAVRYEAGEVCDQQVKLEEHRNEHAK